jgi:putative salt-induced outer membrane protein
MKNRRIHTLRALVALGFTSSAAFSFAGPAAEPAPEPSLWDASFVAGLNLTDGNSDTLGVHAGLSAERISDVDEVYLGADFRYGEDSGAVTSESFSAFAQYNKMLNDRAYFGLVSDFLYDDIAAVDYRISVGPTLGYYLIKNERTRLALEAGVAYQWEDVAGAEADYLTVRFAQRLTHQLTDTMSLFESVVFTPEAEDFNNYNVLARAGIETRMSERMSLNIYAENRYDSTPAAGLEKNDFGVYSGISIALGATDPMPASAKGGSAVSGSDWDTSLGVGFSLTDGNTDTLGVNADLAATRILSDSETYLGAGMAYGETGNVRNTERAYAFGQYNAMRSDVSYIGARADYLYDDIVGLEYRVTPSLLLGRYLVKNDTTQFALEVGPSFTWEEQGGVSDEYFGVSFGQRMSHELSDRLSVWQSANVVLDVDNTDNVIVNAAAGLDVKVGERLTLRTAVENIYDNAPPAGVEENDFRLISGLVWTF